MTRRSYMELVLGSTFSTVSCGESKSPILSKVNQIISRDDLSIVDTLVPEAISVIGDSEARFSLLERPGRLSISADGAWVAWLPYDSSVDPASARGVLIHFTDNSQTARTLRIDGHFGTHLAISSNAEHLAVAVVVKPGPVTRLLVLRTATGQIEYDLTGVISDFNIANLERLRLSSSGERLIAGSRDRFCVIDMPSRAIVFQGAGRFASISPSGEVLAFIDTHRKLNVMTVADREIRRLLGWWTTRGVGSWTPDGALLLAGAQGPLSFFWSLVAVDSAANECAEIARLDEHDSGEECFLVKRRFIAKTSSPG